MLISRLVLVYYRVCALCICERDKDATLLLLMVVVHNNVNNIIDHVHLLLLPFGCLPACLPATLKNLMDPMCVCSERIGCEKYFAHAMAFYYIVMVMRWRWRWRWRNDGK